MTTEHTSACASDTCYAQFVNLQDGADWSGYAEWKRGASNTCDAGQVFGKDICGDLDRQFGTSSTGRLG